MAVDPVGGQEDDATRANAARAARIEQARSDFVANLERRATELYTAFRGLEGDPGSPRHRDELRRRIHALAAGARLLRFERMAGALAIAERRLERAAGAGGVDHDDISELRRTLDALHTLATRPEPGIVSAEPPDGDLQGASTFAKEDRHVSRPSLPPLSRAAQPIAVAASDSRRSDGGDAPVLAPTLASGFVPSTMFVIGPLGLVDACKYVGNGLGWSLDVEHAVTAEAATSVARMLGPDIVVLDADVPGSRDLVRRWQDDPLVDPAPLIVIGNFSNPEAAANWLNLGAVRVLDKPPSTEALTRACADVASRVPASPIHAELGTLTIEQLADRMADEVRRGLIGAVEPGRRGTVVPLGEGVEVLGAMWGAVARIRELVTMRTDGAVRFSGGPEGALPLAPSDRGGAERQRVERGGADPALLAGRTVVIADDDPAVTWFLGGVLRQEKCVVHEVHDGRRALEVCHVVNPDLVITDVLMPELDGFGLCRALKRDVALRDVPVVLLSWKEDLLQRLRELGVSADGYLRKEASAATVVQRCAEVLRSRARIEARLAEKGDVRGRLDGLTTATLIRLAVRAKPSARISIRDACFLYELEVRDGSPRAATRTTTDGSFERGTPVLAAVLGVRFGRFSVAPATASVRGTLQGKLEEQLAIPIAHARAAQHELSGNRLVDVRKVELDLGRMRAYLEATPPGLRSIVERIARGTPPHEMMLTGEASSPFLEEILADLAAHGAVVAIWSTTGEDRLALALAAPPPAPPVRPSSASAPPLAPSVAPLSVGPRSEPPLSVDPAELLDSKVPTRTAAALPGLAPQASSKDVRSVTPPAANASADSAVTPKDSPPPFEPSSSQVPPLALAVPKATLLLGGSAPPMDPFLSIIGDRRVPDSEPEERVPPSKMNLARTLPLANLGGAVPGGPAGSSLEDAVIRQISDQTPEPDVASEGVTRSEMIVVSGESRESERAIVDLSELRARAPAPSPPRAAEEVPRAVEAARAAEVPRAVEAARAAEATRAVEAARAAEATRVAETSGAAEVPRAASHSLPPDAVVPASETEDPAATHESNRELKVPSESDRSIELGATLPVPSAPPPAVPSAGAAEDPLSPLAAPPVASNANTQPPRAKRGAPEPLSMPMYPSAHAPERRTARSPLPEILLLVVLAALGALAVRWIWTPTASEGLLPSPSDSSRAASEPPRSASSRPSLGGTELPTAAAVGASGTPPTSPGGSSAATMNGATGIAPTAPSLGSGAGSPAARSAPGASSPTVAGSASTPSAGAGASGPTVNGVGATGPAVAPALGKKSESASTLASPSAPAGATTNVAPQSLEGEDLAVPADARVPPGYGMLEIQTDERTTWLVDGADIGHGPMLRVVLLPGTHEVRARSGGDSRVRPVVLRPGRRTRVSLSSPFSP